MIPQVTVAKLLIGIIRMAMIMASAPATAASPDVTSSPTIIRMAAIARAMMAKARTRTARKLDS